MWSLFLTDCFLHSNWLLLLDNLVCRCVCVYVRVLIKVTCELGEVEFRGGKVKNCLVSCLHFEAASYLPLLLATAEVISQITHRTHLFLKWIGLFRDGPCHQPYQLRDGGSFSTKLQRFTRSVMKIKAHITLCAHTDLVTSPKHKHTAAFKMLITHYCSKMAANFEHTQLSYTVYIVFDD